MYYEYWYTRDLRTKYVKKYWYVRYHVIANRKLRWWSEEDIINIPVKKRGWSMYRSRLSKSFI